jgi:hypothetical protein
MEKEDQETTTQDGRSPCWKREERRDKSEEEKLQARPTQRQQGKRVAGREGENTQKRRTSGEPLDGDLDPDHLDEKDEDHGIHNSQEKDKNDKEDQDPSTEPEEAPACDPTVTWTSRRAIKCLESRR